MSSPPPQHCERFARTSSLFLPLPGQNAQKSRGHEHQRAASRGTDPDSGEASPEPTPPVQLDTNAAGIALAFLLGSATALGASAAYRRFFKRIKNAEWITPDVLRRRRWITGIVTRYVLWAPTCPYRSQNPVNPHVGAGCAAVRGIFFFWWWCSVGDADNFRLYHTPGFGWRGLLKFRHVPVTYRGA